MIKYLITLFALLLSTSSFSLPAGNGQGGTILFTPERVAAAKERMKSDTLMQHSWEYLHNIAKQKVGKPHINDSEVLCLTAVMTGEKQYIDALIQILRDMAKQQRSFSSDEMLLRKPAWRADLGLASKAYKCAMAYDVAYKAMSKTQRKEIALGLNENFVKPSLEDWVLPDTRIHTLNSMGHNWWTSCAGMGSILALALQEEIPSCKVGAKEFISQLPDWFNFPGDEIQNKQPNFDPEAGGMYESFGYSSFGIYEALKCLIAFKNANGTKVPESIMKHIRLLPQHFIQASYPRANDYMMSMNIGDGHASCTAQEPLMLCWALGDHNPNTLWYFSKLRYNQHRDCHLTRSPLGFLYMPDYSKHIAKPTFPLQHVWKSFGWATMRSSWKDDADMLAVKCGHTWNHAHADAGTFILYHKGVDIIRDGGNCSYPNPPYREYFFQSQAHNVVTFNGEAQPRIQQYQGSMLDGTITLLPMRVNGSLPMGEGGGRGFGALTLNATGPTAKNFQRNFRHFLWLDDVILIIDDLESYELGEYEWLWHPRGEAKNVNGSFQITNGESQVLIRPLFPQPLVPSGFVHDYPSYLYVKEYEVPSEDLKSTEKYYGFCLPDKQQRVKAVNAIILKDSPQQKKLPHIERRQGSNWISVRITWKGMVTDLYINNLADGSLMHSNSWIWCDSWMTDAYMFSVTYKEGTDPSKITDAKEAKLFCYYGSAIRNNGKTLFSSPIKKTFAE